MKNLEIYKTKHMQDFLSRLTLKSGGVENSIQPDFSQSYRPMEASKEHFSWANTYIEPFPVKTPKMHYQMIDFLADEEQEIQSVEVHREGAKTTVITFQKVLKAMQTGIFSGYGIVHNICIFSETARMAVELLKNIRALREANEDLYATTPLAVNKDGKIKSDTEICIAIECLLGHTVYVQVKGSNESMRGTQKDNIRPEVVILDDILGDDQMKSDAARKKTLEWLMGTVKPAMNSTTKEVYPSGYERKRKMIMVGTPMSDEDAVRSMTKSAQVASMYLPVIQNFNSNNEISNWKDVHSIKEIKRDYEFQMSMGTLSAFLRERLLILTNEDTRIFKEKDFRYWENEDIAPLLKDMKIYLTADIAATTKESSDLSAIMTIGVTPDNKWYILMIDVGKFTPRELVDKIMGQAERLYPNKVMFEKAPIQYVLDDFIKAEKEKRGLHFKIEYLSNNSKVTKEMRIRGLEPRFFRNEIYFPKGKEYQEGVNELLTELRGFSPEGKTTRYDDVMDCLANFNEKNFIKRTRTGRGSLIDEILGATISNERRPSYF